MTEYEYERYYKGQTVEEMNALGAQGWQFIGDGVWMREKPSEISYRTANESTDSTVPRPLTYRTVR